MKHKDTFNEIVAGLRDYVEENPYKSGVVGGMLGLVVLYVVLFVAIAPSSFVGWDSYEHIQESDNTYHIGVISNADKKYYVINNSRYEFDNYVDVSPSQYFVDTNNDGLYERQNIKIILVENCKLMSPCVEWNSFGELPKIKTSGQAETSLETIQTEYNSPDMESGLTDDQSKYVVSLKGSYDYSSNNITIMTPEGEYIENYYYNPQTEQYEGKKRTYTDSIQKVGVKTHTIFNINKKATVVYLVQEVNDKQYIIEKELLKK